MTQKPPTPENVLAALPAVQAAVKLEIAGRIAAGEDVAALDLKKLARATDRGAARGRTAKRKSAA